MQTSWEKYALTYCAKSQQQYERNLEHAKMYMYRKKYQYFYKKQELNRLVLGTSC